MGKKSIVGVILFFLLAGAAFADTNLKIAVVNPSGTKEKTTPVRYDLPKGIAPEHIIDIGDMELKYDFDKGNYYVYQLVTLKPSEQKVLEIKLTDVWLIPEEEIKFLKKHTESLMEKLEDTRHFEIGATLSGKIDKDLDGIYDSQKNIALNARERINLYYENTGIMDEAKSDIGMLENLVVDVGGIVEERVEVPLTMAISAGGKGVSPDDIIELRIQASNPSDKNKREAFVKYDLPGEVTPRYITDTGELELAYDFDKEVFYAYKNDVMLEPGETKVFIVKIIDIWRIPELEIRAVRAHTNNLVLLIEGTEYYGRGIQMSEKINFNLEEIVKHQSMDVDASKHIAYYRDNLSRLREAREYVAQLEKMITQSGTSPGVTVTTVERLEGGGIEVQRTRGYEGIVFLIRSIFRGKAPTIATTWRIIWSIIGFLAVISFAFFILQLIYHKISITDLLTGVYTRTYLINQLQEEHRRAEITKGTYSVLMMDVDDFKLFNDNYGHGTGDTVLRTVSTAVKQNIARNFLVGRFGGDEFLIIMPGLNEEKARVFSERIRKAIEEARVSYMGQPLSVHASFGLANYPLHAKTVEVLFSKVDEAMYVSKRAGGNRVSAAS